MLTSGIRKCSEERVREMETGMKTIVIAGARSAIGKTTLARSLLEVLPDARMVKIGHHTVAKPGGDHYFPIGTPLREILGCGGTCRFLIIESNSILEQFTPDCVIYLPADNPKPSAALAEAKADIIRGRMPGPSILSSLAGKLGIEKEVMVQLAVLAVAPTVPVSPHDSVHIPEPGKESCI